MPWHGCRAVQSAQPAPPQPLAPGASSGWKSRQRVLLLPGERQRGAQEPAPPPRLPNGISRSPLKPAVPERRLHGREWIFSPPGWMQLSELPALHASGACLLEAEKYTVTYFSEHAKCIRGAAAAGASLPPTGPCCGSIPAAGMPARGLQREPCHQHGSSRTWHRHPGAVRAVPCALWGCQSMDQTGRCPLQDSYPCQRGAGP